MSQSTTATFRPCVTALSALLASLLLSGCVTLPVTPSTTVPPALSPPPPTSAPCPIDAHGWRIRNLSLPYEEQLTDC